jgi:hypothetical protein
LRHAARFGGISKGQQESVNGKIFKTSGKIFSRCLFTIKITRLRQIRE